MISTYNHQLIVLLFFYNKTRYLCCKVQYLKALKGYGEGTSNLNLLYLNKAKQLETLFVAKLLFPLILLYCIPNGVSDKVLQMSRDYNQKKPCCN